MVSEILPPTSHVVTYKLQSYFPFESNLLSSDSEPVVGLCPHWGNRTVLPVARTRYNRRNFMVALAYFM